jgi:hypothetical protein
MLLPGGGGGGTACLGDRILDGEEGERWGGEREIREGGMRLQIVSSQGFKVKGDILSFHLNHPG